MLNIDWTHYKYFNDDDDDDDAPGMLVVVICKYVTNYGTVLWSTAGDTRHEWTTWYSFNSIFAFIREQLS